MPVKKTTTKKTTAKKVVAKKVVVDKKPTATTATKISNFEKRLDKWIVILQKKLPFVKQIMDSDFVKTTISSKLVKETNTWVKKNLQTISQIIGWVIVVFG